MRLAVILLICMASFTRSASAITSEDFLRKAEMHRGKAEALRKRILETWDETDFHTWCRLFTMQEAHYRASADFLYSYIEFRRRELTSQESSELSHELVHRELNANKTRKFADWIGSFAIEHGCSG